MRDRLSDRRLGLALGLLAALTAGCISSPPSTAPSTKASLSHRTSSRAGDDAVRIARSLLESPYRYGGTTPRGFDCSGLTSYVFARLGVPLARTAQNQSTSGRWVAPDELRPGDLVFFGPSRNKADHVGLVVSQPGAPLVMIHASTSRGVVRTEITASSYWLPRLKFGRRVLPTN